MQLFWVLYYHLLCKYMAVQRNYAYKSEFKKKQKIIRYILIAFIIIFTIIFINVIKILLQKNREDKNIEELNEKIKTMEESNESLKNLIKQANNDTGKEDIIRNNLNMKNEGENVVVITDNKIETEIKLAPKEKIDSSQLKNYEKWYYYFFDK